MSARIDFQTGWQKSSFSGTEANCVEVAFGTWRKSTFSGTEADCVEIAFAPEAVGVRDSKNSGPVLAVTRDSWGQLLGRVQRS
jgi:uncharacterized protein DUF397